MFKMAAILEFGRVFKPEVVREVDVQQQDRPCHFLHFEILFYGLAQILRELWLFQNLTYFLTL